MTTQQRTESFRRLNGQLERVKSQLGSVIGQARSMVDMGDIWSVTQLQHTYDDIKRVQDYLYKRYVS